MVDCQPIEDREDQSQVEEQEVEDEIMEPYMVEDDSDDDELSLHSNSSPSADSDFDEDEVMSGDEALGFGANV